MRLGVASAAIATVLWFTAAEASAQNNGGVVYGMFGPRSIGGSLRPANRNATSGIITAPSGAFIGRGGTAGMTFNPSLWQSAYGQQQQAAMNLRQAQANQLLNQQRMYLPQAEPMGVPSEQWFRAPAVNPAGAINQAPVNQTARMGPAVIGPPTATATANAGAGYEVPAGAAPYVAQRPVVLPVAAGFVAPDPPGSPAAQLAMLLNRTARISKVSPIAVTTENGITVLRGVVRSAHDRQLAEDMARMEPGVWDVRNDLVIGTPVLSALPIASPR